MVFCLGEGEGAKVRDHLPYLPPSRREDEARCQGWGQDTHVLGGLDPKSQTLEAPGSGCLLSTSPSPLLSSLSAQPPQSLPLNSRGSIALRPP